MNAPVLAPPLTDTLPSSRLSGPGAAALPGASDGARQWVGRFFRIGFADILFVVVTLTLMQHASHGMMDDPGLGWHLRIADLMQEQGGFLYQEYFSYTSAGAPWMTRAWLSDIIMRGVYGWGGLNGLALLTCMIVAVTLRCMYRSLRADLVHPLLAISCVIVCASELRPSYTARPNIVSILGMWLVVDLCRKYHAGRISHRKLFYWWIPMFALWANLHGGFMAGLIVIAMTWLIEGTLAIGSWKRSVRKAAHRRMFWLTLAGAAAGLASLINPYGYQLHLYNLMSATDPFIQQNSTMEWKPINFEELDGVIERLILLLPILAITCRKRVNWVGVGLTVAWLHLAFHTRRYSTLWVIIAVPTLCEMVQGNPWLRQCVRRVRQFLSPEMKEVLRDPSIGPSTSNSHGSQGSHVRTVQPAPAAWPFGISCMAAGILLLVCPWMPAWATHQSMPAASLDRFLDEVYQGERTLHSPDHGGFLTWHGWDHPQRFHTYLDDRLEVHGEAMLNQWFRIATAQDGWQSELDEADIRLVCIPAEARLAKELEKSPSDWQRCFVDQDLAVYRRID